MEYICSFFFFFENKLAFFAGFEIEIIGSIGCFVCRRKYMNLGEFMLWGLGWAMGSNGAWGGWAGQMGPSKGSGWWLETMSVLVRCIVLTKWCILTRGLRGRLVIT